ncbi:MAG: hypothetical protein QM784_34205 [Polyangiaceae bacterium]
MSASAYLIVLLGLALVLSLDDWAVEGGSGERMIARFRDDVGVLAPEDGSWMPN